jgi:ankyrin repeat protein
LVASLFCSNEKKKLIGNFFLPSAHFSISQPREILPPEAHVAAKTGQLEELEHELKLAGNAVVEVLTERDENGWQVLHQGVAGGHEDIVKLLVDNGADINSRTYGGYGETPLRIAEKRWGSNNPIAVFLKQHGGLSIGPEL